MKNSIQVAIIMGSQSDWRVMKNAAETLQKFGVRFEKQIVSAHRNPKWMVEFAEQAKKRKLQVIIAGAGGAAHLPGMVASLTTLPVIGVPVQVGKLKGLDALLSIAQMPKGIPVATVAVDNSTNAALLAIRILALKDAKIEKKLKRFADSQTRTIMKKAKTFKKVYKGK